MFPPRFGDRFPDLSMRRVDGPDLALPNALAGRSAFVLVVPDPTAYPAATAYLEHLRRLGEDPATSPRIVVLAADRVRAATVAGTLGPALVVAYPHQGRHLLERLETLHPEGSTGEEYAGFLLAADGTVQLAVHTNHPFSGLDPDRVRALLRGARSRLPDRYEERKNRVDA